MAKEYSKAPKKLAEDSEPAFDLDPKIKDVVEFLKSVKEHTAGHLHVAIDQKIKDLLK